MANFSILDEPFALDQGQLDHYQKHEYIKLKHVLPADVLAHFNTVVTEDVVRLNRETRPLDERDTYGRAFLQVTNLWRHSRAVRPLVFSRRLASIAARLMAVDGVRLYHDQALYKEAGGGHTPWHADQYYWPLASPKTTTVWIPLQRTGLDMGALEFSAGSHRLTEGRGMAISDDSEADIDAILAGGEFEHVVEPYDLGEVSFHSGWLYHRAGPNGSGRPRKVMTVIYMDADMRLGKPENEHQQADLDAWCPGAAVGGVIDTPLNPVLYP